MRVKQVLMCLALLAAVSAAPASAQWFVSPNVGAGFGGDTEDSKFNVGASVGWLGAGVVGFEVDFAMMPDFYEFDDDDFDLDFDGNLTTFMVNGMVAGPSDVAVRLDGTGGIGIIRSRIDDAEDLVRRV